MISLDRAIEMAVTLHRGQKDKAGASYVLHPLRVMLAVSHLGEDAMVVAVLHDTIEDSLGRGQVTDVNVAQALGSMRNEGMAEYQLQALDRVTRRDGVDYDDYIGNMIGVKLATSIKIADLEDNMDIKRLKNSVSSLTERDTQRLRKYLKAWRRLTHK